MLYIYDILLNWNKDRLYDFYEWEKTDKIEHIKKIPLIRIEKGIINKFVHNNIKLEKDFIEKIYNLTESYTSKKVVKIPYAFLLTDGAFVLAIKTDKEGNVKFRSKLIIDEEEEILCFSNKIGKTEINIKELDKIYDDNFLTRKEEKVKMFLKKEFEYSYKEKNNEKLKYLYTEYCGKKSNDIDNIFKELCESLKEEINEEHIKLYELLNLIANKN